jgi:putative Mn2+ efflux pump MntP
VQESSKQREKGLEKPENNRVINMGLISWANEKIKGLNVWDIGCIKWSSILFGVIVGAYIANFTKQYLWLFIVLAVLIAVKPIYKFLKKPQEKV